MSLAPRELQEDERRLWLRLIRSRGVGPAGFFSLLSRTGSIKAALDRAPDLAKRAGGGFQAAAESLIDAEIAAGERAGARLIAYPEADYPDLLRAIPDPPPTLWALGDLGFAQRGCIALVGSRNASAAGRLFAARLGRGLGEAGAVVVSGLARGIDGAAHEGALQTGATIAVLASGVDVIYPEEHAGLYGAIRERGLILSERPIGAPPTARDFPRRNRIISGLSRAVGVIEAAERSGSLITARMANEQGREVLAAPGSPLDPRAAGCLKLLKEGAGVLTGAEDLLACLKGAVGPPRLFEPAGDIVLAEDEAGSAERPAEADEGDPHAVIAELLSTTPVSPDALTRLSGLDAGRVAAVILDLTLAGRAQTDAAGRVVAVVNSE